MNKSKDYEKGYVDALADMQKKLNRERWHNADKEIPPTNSCIPTCSIDVLCLTRLGRYYIGQYVYPNKQWDLRREYRSTMTSSVKYWKFLPHKPKEFDDEQ